MTARYAFAPLAALMGLSEHAAASQLRISGSTEQEYRSEKGMSEAVASRLAVKAGLHPFVVWPEMADEVIEDVRRAELERRAAYARKWRRTRRGRASSRVAQKKWQQSSREYVNSYRRRWRAANPERVKVNNRRYYERNAERILAEKRDRYRNDPEYREQVKAKQRERDRAKKNAA